MSKVSREEFIESNFGRPYKLDIRATIGALTVPTEEQNHPLFRRVDVVEAWRRPSKLSIQAGYYHVDAEVKKMARAGMVQAVDIGPRSGQGLGIRYERTESNPLAVHGWNLVREGALAVAQCFPDDPRNESWHDFVAPLQEQPPQ